MSELIEKQINGSRVIFFNKNQRMIFDNIFAIKEKNGLISLIMSDNNVYLVEGINADELREELKMETDKAIELIFTLHNFDGITVRMKYWEIRSDKMIIYNAG